MYKRKWGDREGGSRSSPWDMSCPRKLFLDERKSSETSACRPTSVRCLKENKYSSAFHERRHFLFSLRTWERGKTACRRLGRQTSARTKTSARLKITFVDITYPGQRPEPPSLSPHFLLVCMYIYIFVDQFRTSGVIRRFITTTFFRMAKGWPHSSGNINYWPVILNTGDIYTNAWLLWCGFFRTYRFLWGHELANVFMWKSPWFLRDHNMMFQKLNLSKYKTSFSCVRKG